MRMNIIPLGTFHAHVLMHFVEFLVFVLPNLEFNQYNQAIGADMANHNPETFFLGFY